MKILVTGGAGYIGSILVPMLLEEGHDVTVLDNFMYRQNSLAQCCWLKRFHIERGDVRCLSDFLKHLTDKDVVIPLAALVGAPICDMNPIDAELVNLKAPLALFNSLSREQIVIMPTTESVYGKNADVCTEDTPVNPLSTYGRHKVEVEKALLARGNSVSLRLATVFGMSPRMRLDLLVNDFTWRAVRDRAISIFEGKYRRTFAHVTDVSRAFVHAIRNIEAMRNQVYNVGSESASKLQICEAIKRVIAQRNEYRVDASFIWTEVSTGRDQDQRDYVVSDAKIRATGYEPRMSLEAGIAELLTGYRMLSNTRYGNVP